jgi:hypothetical protein
MFQISSTRHAAVRAEMRALSLRPSFPVVQIALGTLMSACLASAVSTLFSF